MSKFSQLKTKQDEEQYIDQRGKILFSDMKPQHMQTVNLGPYNQKKKHMVIHPGLSLSGKCHNQDCTIFQKFFWVPKGYGTMNINKLVFKVLCPICNTKASAQTVLSLGYRRAKVKAEGKRENEDQVEWELPAQTEGKFLKFNGYDGATCNWQYLQLQVEEVKEA